MNPQLSYMQLPDEQIKPAMVQMGMSENAASLILEMCGSLNSGYMAPLEKRSARKYHAHIDRAVRERHIRAAIRRPGRARVNRSRSGGCPLVLWRGDLG